MPQMRETVFTTYDFTDDDLEYLNLNDFQVKWFRSMIAEASMSKINLTTKDKTPEEFMRAQAYFEGQIHVLIYMLQLDENRKSGKLDEARVEAAATSSNPRVLTGTFYPPLSDGVTVQPESKKG